MAAETRHVNQCTYTPVSKPAAAVAGPPPVKPSLPFLKQALLSVVFSDRDKAGVVLSALREQSSTLKDFDAIYDAVQALWNGQPGTAAAAVAALPGESVYQFAQAALERERVVLDRANSDVQQTLLNLVPPAGANSEMSRIRSEVASLRETVSRIANVRARVSNVTSAVSSSAVPVPALDPGIPPVASAISRNQLQSELQKSAPMAARYLSAGKFFSQTTPIANQAIVEATHLSAFYNFHLRDIFHRKQTLSTVYAMMRVEPVGYLHLERLQFTPIGYVRGELVYSLPMLPQETIRLTHREWTRTDNEFEQLVAESLDTASQDSLSEKSELTESVDAQQQHSSGFNASASVSGSYGPVTVTAAASYNATSAESDSRQASAKRSREITRLASSRAKKEHKLTFQVSTQHEVEDVSFREFTNVTNDPVRWDFNRLMQKWQIDLFRYDVRLTYDLVIPEPGSYLLRKYIQLKNYDDQLAQPDPFSLGPADITPENYSTYARDAGVSVDAPPATDVYISGFGSKTYSDRVVGWDHVELALPDGYEFADWYADGAELVQTDSDGNNPQRIGYIDTSDNLNSAMLNNGAKKGSRYLWRYYYDWSEKATAATGDVLTITVWAHGTLGAGKLREWQNLAFEKIALGMRASFDAKQERLKNIRDQLAAELAREDSLSLRKIEKEEVMKGVLRWILGPDFSFYPNDLPQLSLSESGDIGYYSKSSQAVKAAYYEPTLRHGEIIKFLHQAIEWENVLYVLYPYFWTDDYRWDFKQFLYHGDFEHRSFLRAGAARVVLTVRPEFVDSFLAFVETTDINGTLPPNHPYLTVATELKNLANTSYPYTPSANPENPKNKIDTWYEYTPTSALDIVKGPALLES